MKTKSKKKFNETNELKKKAIMKTGKSSKEMTSICTAYTCTGAYLYILSNTE